MKQLIIVLILASLACGLPTNAAMLGALPTVTPVSVTKTVYTTTAIVTADMLNFRTGAGEDSPQVGLLPYLRAGDVVTLTGRTQTTPDGAQWVEAEYMRYKGWINARYVEVR